MADECRVCHGIGEIRVRIPARFGSYYNYVSCPACSAPAPEPEPAARKPVIIITKVVQRLLESGKK